MMLVSEVRDGMLRIRQESLAKASRLNRSTWDSIRFVPVSLQTATNAIEQARSALELTPDNLAVQNTLGVALYRAGRYEDSLQELAIPSVGYSKNGTDQPADYAFIAMAHHRLGHEAEAAKAMRDLRDLMKRDKWNANEEAKRFHEEAEQEIGRLPSSAPTSAPALHHRD